MEEKNGNDVVNDDVWLGNIFDDVQPLPIVHPDQQQQVAVDVDVAVGYEQK